MNFENRVETLIINYNFNDKCIHASDNCFEILNN